MSRARYGTAGFIRARQNRVSKALSYRVDTRFSDALQQRNGEIPRPCDALQSWLNRLPTFSDDEGAKAVCGYTVKDWLQISTDLPYVNPALGKY